MDAWKTQVMPMNIELLDDAATQARRQGSGWVAFGKGEAEIPGCGLERTSGLLWPGTGASSDAGRRTPRVRFWLLTLRHAD
jgi:hypothetical protein